MSGATIANEIRAIAAGLAGKRLDVIQVRDLMIDTSKGTNSARKRSTQSSSLADNDRASAESYYKAWARSLDTKLKDTRTGTDNPKPQRVSNPKRPTARKP